MRRRVLPNEPVELRSMAGTLHVVMIASPRMAYAFEQAISNAGLRASWEGPSAGHSEFVDTIRYEFAITGDETNLRPGTLAAIQQLEARFPGVAFEMADDDGDGETE